MPVEAIKITVPAITEEDYGLLCGELRKLRVRSLRGWAIKHKFAVTTTYAAARGRRGGAESKKIQKKLQETLYAATQ
jgi:hypothetical protein